MPDSRSLPSLPELIDNLVLPQIVLNSSKKRKIEASIEPVISVAKYDTPSVIFATVANTYGGLTCVDIGKDVSQVVCGYRDSVVRVYNLKGHRTANYSVFAAPSILPRSKCLSQSFEPAPEIYGTWICCCLTNFVEANLCFKRSIWRYACY